MQELRSLNISELKSKLENFRKEFFTLRLQFRASREQVKDYAQFKKLRRNIARVLTLLTEKNVQG